MITKFKSIKNLAVFKNFDWDKTVLEKDGSIKLFKDINIFYGRNYAGKTTLSRILRSLETGEISNKYEKPSFEILFKDRINITLQDINKHDKKIRVFNEDFIKENLRFIIDPNKDIEPFAILGDDNNKIKEDIQRIERELGSIEQDKETGLYKELRDVKEKLSNKQIQCSKAEKALETQLKNKATGGKSSIKYNSHKFGNQNYNIRELEKDIKHVLHVKFNILSKDEKKKLEKLIDEKILPVIEPLPVVKLKFSSFNDKAKDLLAKPVSESGKIEELVNDIILNKWVKEGKNLHDSNINVCKFCENKISTDRWKALEQHFDEESELLEKTLINLIDELESEERYIKNEFKISKTKFYHQLHTEIDLIASNYIHNSSNYIKSLIEIKNQIVKRKNQIVKIISFNEPHDYSEGIRLDWKNYEKCRIKNNALTESINERKDKAKESLRLSEVAEFISIINYREQVRNLESLNTEFEYLKEKCDENQSKIDLKLRLIEDKKRALNDEEQGAKKVNKYLNDFFGHQYITLQAIESEEDSRKQVRFEVLREGKKAYHLSEGECSLLAFCYFMAKLEDIKTLGIKLTIWIDDPISSLDSNHIFFLYSIIKSKIVDAGIWDQLFISTHNLDFLKYLMKLRNIKGKTTEMAYFLINRKDKESEILPMPKHLKEYNTEFNYLFEQVYQCSEIDNIDESNYTIFYNFGNNARKFLEIYLYYKYPDFSDSMVKMERFFGDDSVPAILIDRVNNEYSHLCGAFERGLKPVEAPEMQKIANSIIKKLKEDKDQFNSLLDSIGIKSAKL